MPIFPDSSTIESPEKMAVNKREQVPFTSPSIYCIRLTFRSITMENMDADLKQRLNYVRLTLERDRKYYIERLESRRPFKGAFLRRSTGKKRKYYYYIKRPGSNRYTYLGNEKHPDVTRTRERRFLESAIAKIDHNLKLIKALDDGFLSYDPASVMESLPQIYRCSVPPVSELYQRESAKWKAAGLIFQKKLPENYPEHKQHWTSDRVKVKTISELLLYEKFKDAGLNPIYELPLVMKDYGPAMYPDITVLSPIDMKTEIYIEYVGRLDRPDYCESFARRLNRYIANGYKPGVNLFFVFGGKDGEVDSLQISKVIADIFGIRGTVA